MPFSDKEFPVIRHFSESSRPFRRAIPRYSSKDYGKMRDAVVIACVDVALIHNNHIFLGKRNIQPLQNKWWVIGGRMNPGEAPVEAAGRKLRREAGLKIALKRFHLVGLYSTVFAVRNEPPRSRGSHTISLTYFVELKTTEIKKIKLDPKEYAGEQWFGLGKLGLGRGSWHPVLTDIVKDIRAILK